MKGITRIATRVMLVFLVFVASNTMFFSSPAIAYTSTPHIDYKTLTEVIKSDLPVIVFFNADWCGECRSIAPIVNSIANDYVNKVEVYGFNIDDYPEITKIYGIKRIPTVALFKNGDKVNQVVGLSNRDVLVKSFGI